MHRIALKDFCQAIQVEIANYQTIANHDIAIQINPDHLRFKRTGFSQAAAKVATGRSRDFLFEAGTGRYGERSPMSYLADRD